MIGCNQMTWIKNNRGDSQRLMLGKVVLATVVSMTGSKSNKYSAQTAFGQIFYLLGQREAKDKAEQQVRLVAEMILSSGPAVTAEAINLKY